MDFDLTANVGNLHRVSPEEPVHAFIHAVAAAIERNAPQTELDAWLACALNTPVEFLIAPNAQAMAWRAVNMREKLVHHLRLSSGAPVSVSMWCGTKLPGICILTHVINQTPLLHALFVVQ